MTEAVPFDAAQHLTSRDAQAELLADAVQTDDLTYIAAALGTIARAHDPSRNLSEEPEPLPDE